MKIISDYNQNEREEEKIFQSEYASFPFSTLSDLENSNSVIHFNFLVHIFFISFSTRIFLLFLLLCVIDPVGSLHPPKNFPQKVLFSSTQLILQSFYSFYLTQFSVYKYTFSHSLTRLVENSKAALSHLILPFFSAQHSQ